MTVQLYFKLISIFDRFFRELTEYLLGKSPNENLQLLQNRMKKKKEAEEHSGAFF